MENKINVSDFATVIEIQIVGINKMKFKIAILKVVCWFAKKLCGTDFKIVEIK